MTTPADAVARTVAAYSAGLDAEIELLHQLAALSNTSTATDVASLDRFSEERTRLLSALVTLEHQIKPLRQQLTAARELAARLPGFERVVARHQEAGGLVSSIIAADHRTLGALRDAEAARRFAAQAIEAGETTLAAYRRVVAPPPPSAAILDDRG